TYLRLDQSTPTARARLRALRALRRCVHSPRNDPHHAPALNQASPLTVTQNFLDRLLGPSSILDTFNSAFATYNLASSIGPLSGSPFINPGLGFATTAGTLIFNASGTLTFTATTGTATVPELSSLSVLAVAMAMLGLKAAVAQTAKILIVDQVVFCVPSG